MAANASATRLRAACLELERLAAAGGLEGAVDLLARARKIQQLTCEELRTRLGA
jgi:hypothetical protein